MIEKVEDAGGDTFEGLEEKYGRLRAIFKDGITGRRFELDAHSVRVRLENYESVGCACEATKLALEALIKGVNDE